MTQSNEWMAYLHSADFLVPLGLPPDWQPVLQPLGQGEYNVNYTFLHPITGQKLVLLLNRGSQMHLADQIGYEFSALEYLLPSGRTPRPLLCSRTHNLLVMEWLPGRPLDYTPISPPPPLFWRISTAHRCPSPVTCSSRRTRPRPSMPSVWRWCSTISIGTARIRRSSTC